MTECLITVGATSIGLAAAKRFIEEGAFVFIFGRRRHSVFLKSNPFWGVE